MTIKTSDSIKNISMALLKAQKEFPNLKKDGTNPHFKSSYVTLDEMNQKLIPILNKHDLILLQPTVEGGIEVMLIHAPTGEFISSFVSFGTLTINNPQVLGSVITYFRRYATGALLSVATEEDTDGEKAMGRTSQPKAQIKPNNVPGLGF